MIRYIVGFLLGTALVLVTVACMPSAGADMRDIDKFTQETRVLKDGRNVECLVLTSGYGYAIDCDWAGAKP